MNGAGAGSGGGPSGAAPAVQARPAEPRLASLDAFRGLDIALMFFVNLSASAVAFPWWFGHGEAGGAPPVQALADFVFPWFLFIVGCAVPFSMASGRGRGLSGGARAWAALRRALLIYGLGVIIAMARTAKGPTGTPISWASLLIWDIFPLIALGYLVAALVHGTRWWVEAGFVVIVLAGKWWLLWSAAPAGFAGVGQPAHAGGPVGLAGTLDGSLKSGWLLREYAGMAELARLPKWLGELVTQGLPACACVVSGVLAGRVLRVTGWSSARRAGVLGGAGAVVTAVALVLAAGGMPMSKNFFTPTFVLVSVGTGAVLLAVLYALLDVWRVARWQLSLVGAAGLLLGAAGVSWSRWLGGATAVHEWAAWWCLGTPGLLLIAWAVIDLRRARGEPAVPARATLLVALGCNALFVYVVGELLWTTVWMNWRVMGPGEWGPQMAFPALQAHWAGAVQPIAGAELSRALGPWLATYTYMGVYAGLCLWLYRRRWFIKV